MIGQRLPLGELSQPKNRPQIRRTYGKKDRSFGKTSTTLNIFLADESLENAFDKLSVNDIDTDSRESSEHKCGDVATSSSADQADIQTKSDEKSNGIDEKGIITHANLSPNDIRELEQLTNLSEHKHVQPFNDYTRKVSEVYDIEKIGEGSYSSVFLLTKRKPEERPDLPNGRTIIKMIPLHLSSEPLNDDTTKVSHVANEIRTLKTMDQVHGFLRYRGVVVVQGSWSTSFLDAFRSYKRRFSKRAENADPEDLFGERQCYALVEMQDAGHELDIHIPRPSVFQMYDIFWMTTIYLAMAEELVEFEHRDLHSSNICVKPSRIEGRIDVTKDFVANMEHEPENKLGLTDLSITIIDYTLSRAKLDDLNVEEVPRSLNQTDEDNEAAVIEKERYEDHIQLLTYRKTSECISNVWKMDEHSAAGKWAQFVPKTNVCWLGYLLAVLFNRAGKQQKTKYVQGSNKTAKRVQDEMIKTLTRVKDAVLDQDVQHLPDSASELLSIAVQNKWLRKDEIENFKDRLEDD